MKPLVFLHGWAQSQQIWLQQREAFPDAIFLNLPGHGGSADVAVDQWLEHIVQQLPDQACVLVGWSLGGMLALQIGQRFPQRIAGLVLVATTPCFRQQPDWQAGCDDALFEAFKAAATSSSARLLNRFFALMLHGDDLSRDDYNHLAKQAIDRQHSASPQALQAGLALLASLDTRASVAKLDMAALILHGDEDAIIAAACSDWLAQAIPESQQHLFQHCGHAPFLTQPERFNTTLHDWWTTL